MIRAQLQRSAASRRTPARTIRPPDWSLRNTQGAERRILNRLQYLYFRPTNVFLRFAPVPVDRIFQRRIFFHCAFKRAGLGKLFLALRQPRSGRGPTVERPGLRINDLAVLLKPYLSGKADGAILALSAC